VEVLGIRAVTQQHRAAAKEITYRTVTLVKNKGRTLPLQASSGKKILVTGYGAPSPDRTP
jgi:beta-glucosidase-like glycosyl hydrolase